MEAASGSFAVEILTKIDWSEWWIWVLVTFHTSCALLTFISIKKKFESLQRLIFLVFLSLVYFSENVNKLAAENYTYISKHQYFDDKGVFISIIFSTPLLIFASILVIMWMLDIIHILINLKRKSLRNTQFKKDN